MKIIESLEKRISELETENKLLRERLDENGFSYADIVFDGTNDDSERYDPDQGARIRPFPITDKVANVFFVKFCRGRQDVYVQRYTSPKNGRNGYYTQCYNRWDLNCHRKKGDKVRCKDCEIQAYKPLNLPLVKAHLEGKSPYGNDVLGIYPMLPGNLCRLLVFDFDNHDEGAAQTDFANVNDEWKGEVNALRQICDSLGIEALVERSRSGKGAHLWIFFSEKIPAKLARQFGFALLEKGAESIDLKSFKYFDRMIPTQDALPNGGLGNVIALPLQGLALKKGNSAFVDCHWNAYPNQLQVLGKTKRLSKKEVEEYIRKWQGANADNADDLPENVKPWKREVAFDPSGASGVVDITLSDRIYIDGSNISNKLKWQIRKLATFSNQQYFRNQAMDLPNYNESRLVYLGEDEGQYIILPRGLREKVLKRFQDVGIRYNISDGRTDGINIRVSFKGELKESQKPAVEEMLKHETGILHASTAFGKTVVCCNMIAQAGVSTLILVDKSDLMHQWLEKLEEFLEIREELPEYKTKGGQIRRRKKLIGHLQGQHDSLTGIVDVAMIRSVKKKDGFHPMLKSYGQVIMDECHHGASEKAIEVLQEVTAKRVYGVTATPKRGDGKEKINEFLLGPIRYRYTAKDRAKEQGIDHLVYPRFTRTVKPHRLAKTPFGHEALELIRHNDMRDEQIINDVIGCVKVDRTPVVLTRYIDHAERLAERLKEYADRLVLLTGRNGTKRRREQVASLREIPDSESLILVGTGSLLGEGFDFPRLDTLFMATPVSGENVVEQFVGRMNRDYEGKENVIVYDYVDCHIPKFDRMYAARLRAYKKIGYELCAGLDDEKDETNAIFDIETYAEVYWHDLETANRSIVISSPTMNTQKVNRIISALEGRQQRGVKITIVTWHPDAYTYGRDEVRMNLMERLRKAGFEIRLVEESCERFAVIDQELVWYGSVNLLSKEDVEDNIMRISSPKIAAELLELTFGSGIEMEEW